MLKRAKEEAQREIEEYKKIRSEQFEEYKKLVQTLFSLIETKINKKREIVRMMIGLKKGFCCLDV